MWKSSILVPIWLIQGFILTRRAVVLWITISVDAFHSTQRTWQWWTTPFSTCACLVLELFEIQAYRSRNLRPIFYFASQMFKSLVFSIELIYFLRLWQSHGRYAHHTSDLSAILASLSGFLVALAYGLYVLIQQRRSVTSLYAQGSHYDADPEEDLSALTLPPRLNTSSKIESKTPVVIRLLRWVNTDPLWITSLPRSLSTVLRPGLYYLRWLVAFPPICLSIPFAQRLPGEPENVTLVDNNPAYVSWNYLRPNTTSHTGYSDHDWSLQPHRLRAGDEEANLDIFSLHDIDRRVSTTHTSRNSASRDLQSATARLLGPRYLCFLAHPGSKSDGLGYTVRKVSTWSARSGTAALPDYVFISYTRRQFYTQAPLGPKASSEDSVDSGSAAIRDKATLIRYAILAAKEAGVSAFWVDFECVRPENNEVEHTDMEDVYRICDIVRAAHSLTIVLGPSLDSSLCHTVGQIYGKTERLLEWGQRLWTVPEALLSPSEHRITIYNSPLQEPERIAKRNLAGYAWDDAGTLRQLIDHYEASLQLTQLELISIALECLGRRQTEQRNAGDVVYVLMGLLRLRPKINKLDSDFQAFARLSLANDSDMILERILSLRTASMSTAWHDMTDVFGTSLWRISPLFQIANIGPNDTVVVGDALGVRIDWTSLKMVDFKQKILRGEARWLWIRLVPKLLVMTVVIYLVASQMIWPAFPAASHQSGTRKESEMLVSKIFGGIILITLAVALPVPYWLIQHMKSDHDSRQARMFGVEGKADLGEVESSLFGVHRNRITWSVDATDEQDEGDTRPQFTVIDTLTCTATTFRANRPPIIAFAGAREGGLLRLLLCSYDATVEVFVKETVIRMESTLSQRMPRLDRFRFAPSSRVPMQYSDCRSSLDSDAMLIPDTPEFRSLD